MRTLMAGLEPAARWPDNRQVTDFDQRSQLEHCLMAMLKVSENSNYDDKKGNP